MLKRVRWKRDTIPFERFAEWPKSKQDQWIADVQRENERTTYVSEVMTGQNLGSALSGVVVVSGIALAIKSGILPYPPQVVIAMLILPVVVIPAFFVVLAAVAALKHTTLDRLLGCSEYRKGARADARQ